MHKQLRVDASIFYTNHVDPRFWQHLLISLATCLAATYSCYLWQQSIIHPSTCCKVTKCYKSSKKTLITFDLRLHDQLLGLQDLFGHRLRQCGRGAGRGRAAPCAERFGRASFRGLITGFGNWDPFPWAHGNPKESEKYQIWQVLVPSTDNHVDWIVVWSLASGFTNLPWPWPEHQHHQAQLGFIFKAICSIPGRS